MNPLQEPLHRHETVLESYTVNGAQADLVAWEESLWCGKQRYAADSVNEPDIEKLMEEFMALGDAELSPNQPEEGWDVCMSFNYLSNQRPSGVFFGFLVESRDQPQGFDQIWLPPGQYMRVPVTEETARAMEEEPWQGGVPPYQWVSETLAPRLGFHCPDSSLPIVEYYRHQSDGNINGCWLYVPVAAGK